MNIIIHDLSKEIHFKIKRGSYINALVLLNLLNEFRKRDNMEACRVCNLFLITALFNSIIQENER